MANTENIEAKLAAYVDGELDAVGRAEIETYLKTNPQHRALIEELQSGKNYLQQLPRASAPPEVAEMISQQLERAALLGDVEIGTDIGAETHFSRWPQVRAIAAVILLTVGLAGVLYYVLPSPKATTPQHVAIVTPDLPRDDATTVEEKARGLTPGTGDNESRELAARGTRGARGGAGGGSGGGGSGGGAAASTIAPAPAPSMNSDARAQPLVAAPSAELCIMVRTPDPAAAQTQLVNYFASNQISYESLASADAIALGLKKEIDPTSPTVAHEMDNVSPGFANPPTTNATTGPIDHNNFRTEIAGAAGTADAMRKQSPPSYFKAKMTREQAANLSETMSQPNLRQIAQVVSPQLLQQQQQQQGKTDEQFAGRDLKILEHTPLPTTNETSPATDATDATDAAPMQADRAGKDTSPDLLSPGDTIHVRVSERFQQGTLADETHTIDEDGYVELPRLGRIKAAGQTPNQITSNVIPLEQTRSRDAQSPRADLVWSIEKVKAEPAPLGGAPLSDQRLTPTTQSVAGATTQPTTVPTTASTTAPTTAPTALSESVERAGAGDEKVEVVVVVQNLDSPSTMPATSPGPPEGASAAMPADATTQPTMTPEVISVPTTQPTSSPSR